MKSLTKGLKLNKMTIEILDEKALQNVKGGSAEALADSCGFASCNTKKN
ncbi:MAG: class I lanthipeptide [Saprospiraceae bacterium]|nr:class I lanthipeptide [Lewinella sp.]